MNPSITKKKHTNKLLSLVKFSTLKAICFSLINNFKDGQVHLMMVTPGQFDDAEGEEVAVEEKGAEGSDDHWEVGKEQCWEEGEEEFYAGEDSDGEDFIDEYVEASKGALHESNHPNQQV